MLKQRQAYFLSLEPSVAQPPLPLQEFLPLQPLSPAAQPPFPLHEFWPLQACFSTFLSSAFFPVAVLSAGLSEAIAVVPARNPLRAAPITSARIDFVMIFTNSFLGLHLERSDLLFHS